MIGSLGAVRGAGSGGRPRPSWRTFIDNHADAISARDVVVQSKACFVAACIFVIIELGSRRIVWVNATSSPSLDWVKAQIRQACPFDASTKSRSSCATTTTGSSASIAPAASGDRFAVRSTLG